MAVKANSTLKFRTYSKAGNIRSGKSYPLSIGGDTRRFKRFVSTFALGLLYTAECTPVSWLARDGWEALPGLSWEVPAKLVKGEDRSKCPLSCLDWSSLRRRLFRRTARRCWVVSRRLLRLSLSFSWDSWNDQWIHVLNIANRAVKKKWTKRRMIYDHYCTEILNEFTTFVVLARDYCFKTIANRLGNIS